MKKGLPIQDINLSTLSLANLTKQLKLSGGFTAKKVGIAADILQEMFKDKNCIRILSFPACIISTGTRGIIKELVRQKKFDIIITTSGTLDHDLSRIWKPYFHGSFLADDRALRKKKINREGNILIPNACHGEIIEEKLHPMLQDIYKQGKKDLAPYELVWEIGKRLEKESKKEESITYWAWRNKIPMFIPAPSDGTVGWHLWYFWQRGHKDFNINIMKDEQKLSELLFSAKKTGALIIGGGISKHHTIWWNQFKGGLNYAIYITTAVEWDGSLSGARPREAISWGKINEKAKFVTVEGDATVILPLLCANIK